MRAKLITLRYSATLGGFDDTPLAEFARDKELLAFREHFFSVSEVPHLTCVLLWQDAVVAPAGRRAPWRSEPLPIWRIFNHFVVDFHVDRGRSCTHVHAPCHAPGERRHAF